MQVPIEFLANKAYQLRKLSLLQSGAAGSGHPTSCLSAADIVAVLFWYGMSFDPDNFQNPNNDRFILSKGHASALLYAAWHLLDKVSYDQLMTYRQFNSSLEGHPTFRFAYTEAATGALGTGLPIGIGEAITAKMDGRSFYTYILLGDAELTEGANWEAAEVAYHYKLDNVVAIVDVNRLGQSAPTIYEHHLERYQSIFAAFGWHVITVDGHSLLELMRACESAKKVRNKPIAIIAKTFKGYGIHDIENKEGFHGKALIKEQLESALQQLDTRFAHEKSYTNSFVWQPNLPQQEQQSPICKQPITVKNPSYQLGTEVATRMAYGQALAEIATQCESIISLDAEVKNSTYAEIFEKKFPERFVQCFVAEQNMVGMAIGCARRGKIPFVSTFASFLTRAHDHIRMAAIGQSPLRIVGSHAGVSIGEDGPSQMGLEDIAMMRALPESVVLYPADAVSTFSLVGQMANYTHGISYLRTTRMATPIIYNNSDTFRIGGCAVLKQSKNDVACVVAAGVTLFEALKAYELLRNKSISIAVIDLYSIKPLDVATLHAVAAVCDNRIITVEDHYRQGGLGEAVAAACAQTNIDVQILAVDALPRSGKPAELLAWAGIDAAAIIQAVQQKVR